MKAHIVRYFVVVLLGLVGLQALAQAPQIEKGMHWSDLPTHGFEMASQSPVHPVHYVKKQYRYQYTGKVSDFFKEMGRPDKFTRQSIGVPGHPVSDPAKSPLCATFKYEYKDGTIVYMETGQMEWVFLAFLGKKGKKYVDLLYK